jgi:amidohydrolase
MEKALLRERLKPRLQPLLERYFKWFHQHPEPANRELETTARIREILDGEGIEILGGASGGLKTGLVARIRHGGADGPAVALRCDIDALPVREASGLPYSSLNDGFMHACGHDFHTASLIGAALLLNEERDALAGTVKLVFQPAEEGGRRGAAGTGFGAYRRCERNLRPPRGGGA